MHKHKITLTAGQISDLVGFLGDAIDSPDTEITIEEFPNEWFDPETQAKQPAGLYAHFTEYPEEGVYGPLGVNNSTFTKNPNK
jgi:hypothetical protein